jgi:hypothetical protein
MLNRLSRFCAWISMVVAHDIPVFQRHHVPQVFGLNSSVHWSSLKKHFRLIMSLARIFPVAGMAKYLKHTCISKASTLTLNTRTPIRRTTSLTSVSFLVGRTLEVVMIQSSQSHYVRLSSYTQFQQTFTSPILLAISSYLYGGMYQLSVLSSHILMRSNVVLLGYGVSM